MRRYPILRDARGTLQVTERLAQSVESSSLFSPSSRRLFAFPPHRKVQIGRWKPCTSSATARASSTSLGALAAASTPRSRQKAMRRLSSRQSARTAHRLHRHLATVALADQGGDHRRAHRLSGRSDHRQRTVDRAVLRSARRNALRLLEPDELGVETEEQMAERAERARSFISSLEAAHVLVCSHGVFGSMLRASFHPQLALLERTADARRADTECSHHLLATLVFVL